MAYICICNVTELITGIYLFLFLLLNKIHSEYIKMCTKENET